MLAVIILLELPYDHPTRRHDGLGGNISRLQLGLSIWRLSWITFIFLPLTFIVSFFGMNVDIFGGADGDAYPNVGWYFLAAIILMIFGEYLAARTLLSHTRRIIFSAAAMVLRQAFPPTTSTNTVPTRRVRGSLHHVREQLSTRVDGPVTEQLKMLN